MKGRKSVYINPSLFKKATKMLKDGYDRKAIAIYLNVPYYTINYWFNKEKCLISQKKYYKKNRAYLIGKMKEYWGRKMTKLIPTSQVDKQP